MIIIIYDKIINQKKNLIDFLNNFILEKITIY
jgi:hypothetical protein